MKNQLLLFALTALLSFGAAAQRSGKKYGIEDKLVWKEVKTGNYLMAKQSFYNAIDHYLVAAEKLPDNAYINHNLATCYFIARDYANAEKFYALSTAKDNTKKPEYPMDWFRFGETLKMNGKYKEAQQAFTDFGKVRTRDKEVKEYKRFVKHEISSCTYAMNEVESDSDYVDLALLPDPINMAYTDFSPLPFGKDTLIFASTRQDSVIRFNKGEQSLHPVRLYQTVKEGEIWGDPTAIEELNHDFAHTANGAVSSNGQTMYFSRCTQNRQNVRECLIYYAKKEEGNWSKPKKVGGGVNMASYSSSQPSVGTYVKKRRKSRIVYDVLYFSSNKPKGKGGMDIWYALIDQEGNVSKVKNCGTRVNTARNEITPYFSDIHGKLFFSSNYHNGLGGMDVFSSEGYMGRWASAEHLGMPVNSSYDDTYFVPVEDTASEQMFGYLVSNRPGGKALHSATCCDDIYSFAYYTPPTFTIEGLITGQSINIEKLADGSTVQTVGNTQNLEQARIGFVRIKDLEKMPLEERNHPASFPELIQWFDTTMANGQYSAQLPVRHQQYALVVQREGYSPKVLPINEKAVEGQTLAINANLERQDTTAQKHVEETLAAAQNQKALTHDVDLETLKKDSTGKITLTIKDLYFEFDKDVVKKSSTPALDMLEAFLTKYPNVKVEIAGHTDSRGSNEYNQYLSERRANRVMQHMVDRGIPAERMTAKGYGEVQPIAPNDLPDGEDNPEGRKLNRRTEIHVFASK